MPWTEKYRPKKFSDIKGQNEIIKKIISAISKKTNKKAIILHGPPGIGKTSLAYVIANETNSEIFELNASDLRNKEKLNQVLKPAIEQKSLNKKNKIILVDEIDGISGYYDRGGVSELLKLIVLSKYQIIITANDIWKKNLVQIRKKAELIELKEIDYKIIQEILKEILNKENLILNPNIIKSIAIRSKGDIRASINDLQSNSRVKDPSIISLDERDKEIDIFNVLRHIFKGKPVKETLKLFNSLKMPLDEIILWIEKNIPEEYSSDPEALSRAYEILSKVDLFRGRIYKQQYWRFLVYENDLLSYGISASKNLEKTPNMKFVNYKKPSRILKIWIHNKKIEKKKSITEKYAKYTHTGKKYALNEFPLIKQIIKKNPKISEELKLNDEEINYLNN
jgi:replication factor C large subunit